MTVPTGEERRGLILALRDRNRANRTPQEQDDADRLADALEALTRVEEEKAQWRQDFITSNAALADAQDRLSTLESWAREAGEALKQAKQFIENGAEFGYVRMPTSPDPALETLPTICAVLARKPGNL